VFLPGLGGKWTPGSWRLCIIQAGRVKISNGTIEAADDSVPFSGAGGELEIQGTAGDTGCTTVAPGATPRLDGALGIGQAAMNCSHNHRVNQLAVGCV
jgi:hypothetical protein